MVPTTVVRHSLICKVSENFFTWTLFNYNNQSQKSIALTFIRLCNNTL